jgi:microcin C transport system permease protein
MLWDYIRFDFGDSLFRSASVLTLIKQSLPVSVTLGLWGTLIIYLVSIPLGIRKAVYNGSRFDIWSSTFIIIGYAIPAFLFAVLLIVFLPGAAISTSSRCAVWSPPISAPCRGIRKSPTISGISRCRCWPR